MHEGFHDMDNRVPNSPIKAFFGLHRKKANLVYALTGSAYGIEIISRFAESNYVVASFLRSELIKKMMAGLLN